MDILIIEDDPAICQTIRNAWPTPGDALRFVSSYSQSLGLILGPELAFFDAIVVDIHLPDGDGLSILRSIRRTSSVPIVMISGWGTADSRAGAFDVGADDYLMKPLSVRELQARVARLVSVRASTSRAAAPAVFQIGKIVCDLHTRRLRRQDRMVGLTDTEGRVLGYLHENAGRSCSKSAIYKHAFFREYHSGDKTLDVYIGRLRAKLASLDSESVALLQTARGSGYKLESSAS